MSVKRKKQTSSASKKTRTGRRAAAASRPSSPAKAKAAKARPKKAVSSKTTARKTAAKAGARKAAAPARAAKPKTASPAKAKTAAKAPRRSAKAEPAKGTPKSGGKTARTAGAGAPASHEFVDFAPIRAEADRIALHGEANRSASDGPGAQKPAGASPAPAARPAVGSAGKGAADDGEAHEAPPRANKLVPTNAVHTTKRRAKQSFWQSPTFGATATILVLALLVIGYQPEPPEVTPMEQRADAGPASDAPSEYAAAPISDPVQAAPDRSWPPKSATTQTATTHSSTTQVAAAPTDMIEDTVKADGPVAARPAASSDSFWSGIDIQELIEMEQLLARLDLGPSQADGIVDQKTESAIRLYQQIAGLPVDGEPSSELLDDMRAVVKMLDGSN